jgi:hypothetical protein
MINSCEDSSKFSASTTVYKLEEPLEREKANSAECQQLVSAAAPPS